MGRGSFANQAQAQQNAQNARRRVSTTPALAQQLAQQQSGFNAQNAARNQYMQEQYAQRNQPLNEIARADERLPGAAAELAQLAVVADRDHRYRWADQPEFRSSSSRTTRPQNQNWNATMGGILGARRGR